MPNVQHSGLSDPELHEPKGVSTASSGEVYVADGAGSGVWSLGEGIDCTKTLGTTGNISLPGGLIMKWGTVTPTGTTATVTFASAFPTACVHVSVTELNPGDTGGSGNDYQLRAAPTAFSFQLSTTTTNPSSAYWMAIGY